MAKVAPDQMEELRRTIEQVQREAKSAVRRGRVLGQMAARAADQLKELDRRLTEENARDTDRTEST